jgi:hypothetical protein
MEVVSFTPLAALTPLPPGTHYIPGWADPRAGLDSVGKSLAPAGKGIPAVQLVARRYTNLTVPASIMTCISKTVSLVSHTGVQSNINKV